MKKTSLALLLIFGASQVNSTGRYVDSGGSDTGDCSVTPCLTLQYAIDQSSSGDTINVNAGTYAVSGLVSISKPLILLGAHAGVDARFRSASESILSNTQGISVSASGVVIDGFTIQDSSVSAYTGYGIWLNPGIDGTQVLNNIFTNNIVGLGLANLGTTQAVIQYNLFQANNLPGAASGTGIYTDQYVCGKVVNVLISENIFENNDNAGISFSSEDGTNPDSSITITGNYINNCGRGMLFFNTEGSTVDGNMITNLTTPTDGGNSVAIGIYGGVNDLSVTNNNLDIGVKYGVRIANLSGALPGNTDLAIHSNNISGFDVAGMYVGDAPAAASNYATCNWWGDSSGPYNATLNPGGTGNTVDGALIADNFNPWLFDLAPYGSCGQSELISLGLVFAPNMVYKNDRSNLVITLTNQSDSDATLTEPLVDTLPVGLEITGFSSNTCDGDLIADKKTRTIILVDGVIPHNGFCNIYISVKGSATGVYSNYLPENALVTDQGSNMSPAEATLTVVARNQND